MRGKTRHLALLAVLAWVVAGGSFSGCGNNDNAAPPPQISGTEFTSANMEATAAVGASTLDLMYNIGAIFAGIAVRFQPGAPASTGPSPLLPVDLGSSGLCIGGATLDNVTWNDLDNSGTPTAGDTITVELQNCIIEPGITLSGTPNPAIRFTLANVNATPPPFTFQGALTLNLTVTDDIGSSDIDGIMAAEASTTDFVTASVTLGADNGTSANTQITLAESGTTLAFGCFRVRLDFLESSLTFFSMWARGITKMSMGGQSQIMQIGSYDDKLWLPLNFEFGVPASGQLKLLGYDSRGSYGLNSCYGGPTTGSTSELLTALPFDGIQLEIFPNNTWTPPADNTVNTSWFILLD